MDGITVIKNFMWRLAERVGAQGVKLIVELLLARMLLPEDYGVIALVTVFIAVFNVFVDSGLGNALIQKKEADDLDFSSVFWFNIIWCIILYTILFFLSPIFAAFYRNDNLCQILRILGLQIVISGVKNVYQAYVSRNMLFKKFFFSTIGGTIGAALVGIYMAYTGFGVWALVGQQLFNVLVDTVILCFVVKWHPKFQFSFYRLRGLFNFGWKLLISALLDTVYNEIRQLIIGKVYSSSDLAYYNRGQQLPQLITANINSSIDSVLLPAMSKEQDIQSRVRLITRRAIMTSTFIMAPMMVGLAFIGEPLVKTVLTEKWLSCVPFMRVFCFAYLFYPIHTANLNAIKAMGRSDLFLKLEILKKIVGASSIVLTMHISVYAMAYSLLFTGVICQIINSWPNRKLLDYKYIDQIKDITPNVLTALLMGGIVFPLKYLPFEDIVIIVIQVLSGIVIYVIFSLVLKNESFHYLLWLIKNFKNQKFK